MLQRVQGLGERVPCTFGVRIRPEIPEQLVAADRPPAGRRDQHEQRQAPALTGRAIVGHTVFSQNYPAERLQPQHPNPLTTTPLRRCPKLVGGERPVNSRNLRATRRRPAAGDTLVTTDRKSTRLNSSHVKISY